MRIVFAGTPEPAVPSLRRLIESERHEVVAVVTRPDAVAGRGRKLVRSPIGQLADEHGIEVLTPKSASDPEFLARLQELAPDACPVVAYGNLLPRPVLDVPRFGWMNLHFSLLPAWRGAAPVQAAINAGDEMTGATVFALDEGMDTGPVYAPPTRRARCSPGSRRAVRFCSRACSTASRTVRCRRFRSPARVSPTRPRCRSSRRGSGGISPRWRCTATCVR